MTCSPICRFAAVPSKNFTSLDILLTDDELKAITPVIMSFSTLVSDIAFRDAAPSERGSQISHARSQATARSLTSTRATSVSISGDISSQLHAGYSHPLARSWQSERQLTKVQTTSRKEKKAQGSSQLTSRSRKCSFILYLLPITPMKKHQSLPYRINLGAA
jgi:hypothetical protein